MEKFRVDCYDILTVEIDIIGFEVNIISDLGFTIILYHFYFIFFWKVNTKVFSLGVFFINSQLNPLL